MEREENELQRKNEYYATEEESPGAIAGADWGFSQGAFNPRVHSSIMWAKLEALTDGATLASRRLWG